MKKRLTSAILLLCMLLSLVPTVSVAAGAEQNITEKGSAVSQSKAESFLDLYIGADGGKTEMGGALTVLLSAYKGHSSANLTDAVWTNLVDGATENATLGGTWTAYENGGIGYDLGAFNYTYMLSLAPSLLPTDTYTLEIVSSVRGITKNADGVTPINVYGTTAAISLGCFRGFLFCGPLGTSDPYHTRYGNSIVTIYTEDAESTNDSWSTLIKKAPHSNVYMTPYREDTSVMTLGISLTSTETAHVYNFHKNGVDVTPYTRGCAAEAGYAGSFIINRSMPATYYAVRLYTKPLTAAEEQRNRALDVLLYLGYDFSSYLSIHEDDRDSFLALVGEKGFSATKRDVDEIVADLAAARAIAAEAAKKTAYDALYVGANGEKTENGGGLSVLLSAYDTASVVSFDTKTVWYDKMGNHNGTLSGGWVKYAGGGVGYDLAAFDYSYYLSVDEEALPTDTYTLEIVSSVRGITKNADGVTGLNTYANTASMSLGRFRAFLFCGPLGTSDPYHNRYGNTLVTMYSESKDTATDAFKTLMTTTGQQNTWMDAYREDSSVLTLAITLQSTDTKYNYTFLKNGFNVTHRYVYGCDKTETAYVGSFIVNRSVPGTMYAIRLYTKPLTEAELARNHFVDLLAYTGTDPTEYKNWDAETRAFVEDAFKESAFLDKAAFDEALANVLDLVVSKWDPNTSLYVTDGLELLLASYEGFSTAARFSDTSVLWTNAVKDATFGTLVGKGWYRSEDGGIRIRETIPQLSLANKKVEAYRSSQKNDYYLNFDYSYLPEGSYTIESIVSPEGLTVEDSEGNVSLLYDDYSTYGIYTDRMFVIGPYRSIGWVCDTACASGQDLQRRWLYQTDGCWMDRTNATRERVGDDLSLGNLREGQIVNYTIAHEVYEEADKENVLATYTTSCDGALGVKSEITADKYLTKDALKDKTFDMWRGMAATHYSIRIYSRLLSEDEILQNHIADVCYYLGLDTALLEETLSKIPDKTTIFKAFAHFDFTMSKEEAQSDLDNGMAGIWVLSEDVAVKKDMSDAIRFYFTIQYSSVTAIMQAGFSLELGTLVNLSGDMPNLAEGAFDYRFVAFDSVSGAHRQYFLDEDTYAVTLSYRDGNIDLYNQNLKVVSYVRLTGVGGEEMIFYGGFAGKEFSEITSFFTVLNYLSKLDSVKGSEVEPYISDTVESCYYEKTVYFDSNAEGEGNGSKDAPYTDFAQAFYACNEALVALDRPTNVRLLVAGGTHSVTEVAEFDFDEVSYPYYYYTVEGDYLAEELPELTTAVGIDASAFTAVAGKAGLYVYEFAPDESGKYPAFRNLYVNGTSATYSHTTPITTGNGERPYVFRFDRDVDGTYLLAKHYYESGVLAAHSPEVEYAGKAERTDLIAAYTKHYNQFMEKGAAYAMPAVDTASRPGRLYVQLDMIESLRTLVNERLALFEAQTAYWTAETVKRTELLADKKAVEAAARADYEKKLAAAGAAGATDEEKVAYVAAKAVLDAAILAVDEAAASLADAEWRVYDPLSSYKRCLRGLNLEIHMEAEWCYNIMDVDGIDFEDVVYYNDVRHGTLETLVAVYINEEQYKKIQIGGDGDMTERLFSVQNALSFVDEEGEYFYDENEGKLYYYTEYDIEELSFSVPTMDNLFIFHNAENLVISDLTVWGLDHYEMSEFGLAADQGAGNALTQTVQYTICFTRCAAIAVYDAKSATVRDCCFHDLGAAGIYMQGRNENVVLSGNSFENIGAHAINIAGCDDVNGGREYSKRSGAQNILITENYLHSIATVSRAAPAITLPSTKDAELSYNTIIGCSYTGISMAWYYFPGTWEEHERYNLYNIDIHHNYITDFMQDLGDGGAIYVLGGNLKPDNPKQINFVHHNYVVFSKHTGNGMGMFMAGYYFDGSSSNWSNYNNVCVYYSAIADKGQGLGVSDEAYHMSRNLRASSCVYKQHQENALSHNIHSYNNYFYNLRAKSVSAAQSEAHKMHAKWQEHGHKIYGSSYFFGENRLAFSNGIKVLIEECGSRMHPGEWGWLLGNDY